ncbi:hypothetical protein VIGAN_07194600, partial [Vigna angularis var. angularis]
HHQHIGNNYPLAKPVNKNSFIFFSNICLFLGEALSTLILVWVSPTSPPSPKASSTSQLSVLFFFYWNRDLSQGRGKAIQSSGYSA